MSDITKMEYRMNKKTVRIVAPAEQIRRVKKTANNGISAQRVEKNYYLFPFTNIIINL